MILDAIVARIRERLLGPGTASTQTLLHASALAARRPLDFEGAFRRPGVHVIAEIKFASPSEGEIRKDQNPEAVAAEYLEAGATAISVLTEPDFFRGDLSYLSRVRRRFPEALLLRKDFVVDERQVLEARVAGADAVLLIARLLPGERLGQLLRLAREVGLAALVEAHDEDELESALGAGATLIGVNNRDLDTLKVSLDVCRRLAPLVPPHVVAIAESGIHSGADIRELQAYGYRGFLVGTVLMRAGSPGTALETLRREAACE